MERKLANQQNLMLCFQIEKILYCYMAFDKKKLPSNTNYRILLKFWRRNKFFRLFSTKKKTFSSGGLRYDRQSFNPRFNEKEAKEKLIK